MLQLFIIFVIIIIIVFKVYQKLTFGIYNSDVKMTDKVVIVTGSNTGIGYTTAEDLAGRGARVILACRDPQKGKEARDKIVKSTRNENIVFKQLDLTSFQSVRHFADDIMKTEPKLHVLVNNAGTGNLNNSITNDNLPIEAQVNHFSPFLLTTLLLPLLKSSAPSRIVNVSSLMHNFGTIDDLDKQAKNFLQQSRVYSNTKLANILFTKKLSEILRGTGVTANSLHPGEVNTDIFRNRSAFIKFLLSLLFKTTVQGAQTSIYAAVEPAISDVTGKYFDNCREKTPANKANDAEAARRLWELSENVVNGKKNT